MNESAVEFNQLLNCMKALNSAQHSIYELEVQTIEEETVKLDEYKDKVLLIVNIATECRFTPQLKDLERLYQKYQKEGLEILALPCDQFLNHQESNEDILHFCKTHYNITFPLFSKIEVNGTDAHALYKYLKAQSKGFLDQGVIKWNFAKFLINQKGELVNRYSSIIQPLSIEEEIKQLLLSQ